MTQLMLYGAGMLTDASHKQIPSKMDKMFSRMGAKESCLYS